MPTAQSRGHGLTILSFWCLAALVEIFALISYRSSLWFFQPIVRSDPPPEEIHIVRFGYWIFRLIATLSVFFIGLRAPGVPRRRYAVMLNRSQSQTDEDPHRKNVWLKFFGHFKTLAPYIWPRGHCGLQINILICVVILLLGRLFAIEIPRYTKLISKFQFVAEHSLKLFVLADDLIKPGNGTTDTFLNLGARLRAVNTWPWRLVTILMVLRFLQGKAFERRRNLPQHRSLLTLRFWTVRFRFLGDHSYDFVDENRAVHHSHVETARLFSSAQSVVELAFDAQDRRSPSHCRSRHGFRRFSSQLRSLQYLPDDHRYSHCHCLFHRSIQHLVKSIGAIGT